MFSLRFPQFGHSQESSLKLLMAPLERLGRTKLWLQILIAMALGIGVGVLLSSDVGLVAPDIAKAIGEWLALPGYLFLAFIQMIVVPLILASIIRGLASAGDIQQLKTTGLWLGFYFLGTTMIAASMGIGLGLIVRPGTFVAVSDLTPTEQIPLPVERPVDGSALREFAEVPSQITGVLPTNPISSIVKGEMLDIVIFAVILGIGLLSVKPSSARPLLDLFGAIQEVAMAIVGAVMSFAPLAVFGLLAQAMIKTGPAVLTGLGIYSACVVGGMGVLLIFYILLAMLLGGRRPDTFFKAIREPLLFGFSTNSSAATMPVTVKSAEDELHVKPAIAQFVVPLGATVNMGGTAMYQGLATIFMAQMFGMDLTLGALAAIVFTALGASIGTPAVPGVGIIVLSSVLATAGVPLAGLPLIVGVDRVLERFRTSLNVTGDLVACTMLERLSQPEASGQSKHSKQESAAAGD